MRIFKYLILTLLLLSNCVKVFAATGCLIGSTLYTGTSSSTNFTNDYTFGGVITSVLVNCPVNDYTSLHAVNIKRVTHWFWGDSDCRITASGSYIGTTQTYDLVLCPIDDYIPYILLGIGGMGFFFIRKRSLAI